MRAHAPSGWTIIVRMYPALWFADNAEDRETLEKNLRLRKEDEDDEDAEDFLLDLIEQCYPERKRSDWTERSDPSGNLYFTTKWLKPRKKLEQSGRRDRGRRFYIFH